MNIKKVEKQLKKINQIVDNIKEENSINSIERDLLLSYLRDMYERVLDLDDGENNDHKKVKNSTLHKEREEPRTTVPVSVAEVVMKEVVETTPEPVKEVKKAPEPAPAKSVEAPTVAAQKTDVATKARPDIPEDLALIFEDSHIGELSEKLSRSKISDLTRSMGINEKIFTVKELFGGDSSLFNKTMSDLNGLASMEDAKAYLINNIALSQNWAEKSKLKKADLFVKLVSRKFV